MYRERSIVGRVRGRSFAASEGELFGRVADRRFVSLEGTIVATTRCGAVAPEFEGNPLLGQPMGLLLALTYT